MPFGAFDLLAAVEAAVETAPFDRLDRLAVQQARRGLRVSSGCATDLRAQGVVQPLPGAVLTPATDYDEAVPQGTRSRGMIRHWAPLRVT